MKTRVSAVLSLLWLVWMGSVAAQAQESSPGDQVGQENAVAKAPPRSYLRVVKPYVGNPILIIDYPWTAHARPSVEIQMLAEGQPDPLDNRPLGFVSTHLKGEFAADVFRCQDHGEQVAFLMKTVQQGMDIEVTAKRNSLSKSAVSVVCHWKTADLRTETRTVFCLLDAWSADRRTLYLDLPVAYHSQAGRVRVWMLRGADTVWMQTIAWPGIQSLEGKAQAWQDKKQAAGPGKTPASAAAPDHAETAPPAGKPAPQAKPADAKAPKPAGKPADDGGNPFGE